MDEIEADGRERGATVMSLNVMVTNERARSLYERLGFEEEMIRASKPLSCGVITTWMSIKPWRYFERRLWPFSLPSSSRLSEYRQQVSQAKSPA